MGKIFMKLNEVWLIDYARTAFSRCRPKTPERDVFGEIRADELLAAFGLTEVSDKYPGQLSQGEASRLSVVRALASQAKVLVMDEPLVHVDQAHWPQYWDFIRASCASHSISLVFSTHSPELVLREV